MVVFTAQPLKAQLFAADNPISFFTNVASRLLSSELNLSLNRIQVYPTNQYTPSVHRLLQVTANIYDATTTNFYPSVFRPVFERAAGGQVFIVGYTNLQSANGPNTVTGPADPQLAQPYEVAVLAALPAANVPITDANGLVNVYGVPWIIGAKKHLPGLNQFSLVNSAQFVRKLQVGRATVGDPIWTNQMNVISVGSQLGVSFWNSYSNDYAPPYSGPLKLFIYVSDTSRLVLTNSDHPGTPTDLSFSTNFTIPLTRWPGSKWSANGGGVPDPNSFVARNWTNQLISELIYKTGSKSWATINDPDPWEVGVKTLPPLPQFGLLLTNWLRAVIVDDNHVIDYVHLRGPINNGDLNDALKDPNYPDQHNIPYLWSTNGYGVGGLPSYGIYNQIAISSRSIAPPLSAQWRNPGVSIPGITDLVMASRIFFAAVLSPDSMYRYRKADGTMATYTNYQLIVQAPYTASRTVFMPYLYQVNDPLVHYLASDLDVGEAGVWADGNTLPNGVWRNNNGIASGPVPTPPSTEIVIGRYQPWGKSAPTVWQTVSNNFGNPYSLLYKDPLVWSSDYWNFPTGQPWSLNWLGRVHRGTPWQTIYLKAQDVLSKLNGNQLASGTNTWMAWTGVFGNQEAQATSPVADRHLVSSLAALLNTNDLHTQFSVNTTDPNAWAALLNGFMVLTNSAVMPSFVSSVIFPTKLDPLSVSSNSLQAAVVAEAIQTLRANQHYYRIGDILAAPKLTEQSPFLNWISLNQQKYGISDEAYEAIPSQLLSRLREDSFGTLFARDGQMQVQFSGYDGHDYIVQASSNLVDWINFSTNAAVNGVFGFPIPPPVVSSRQFYRSQLK